MAQQDIAVQTDPPETATTAALRALAASAGWCVAHTTDGKHAETSLHYVGRAVDLASFDGPGVDTPQLAAIAAGVVALVPLPLISELIWAGPAARYVKDGRLVDGLAAYGAETLAGHHNHVHLAVVPGFTFTSPIPEVPPMTVQVAAAFAYEGGYVVILTTGQVYAFGCSYRGGVAIDAAGHVTVDIPK